MKVKLKFKERLNQCLNLTSDLLNNKEDFEEDYDTEKKLNQIYELLTEIVLDTQ